jgi:valyl-tRNA synthetase
MTAESMDKAYSPAEVEKKWYPEWEGRGYFHADINSPKPFYTIVIPPPNVTGILTLGHVLNNTLQDIVIRWERMRGKECCWIPGTDHAGIATQSRVEAMLKKEQGLTRYDLGREKFLEQVWSWKQKYGGTIIQQLRSIGSSCDWERERFTLDEGLSKAVQEVFIRLYNDGLVYKGTRIINWCPKSRTALSDEEVIYQEEKGSLWHFRYPLADGSGFLVVATTRPETMLGDTAVAVNPKDERYAHLIGKRVLLPIAGREIPVVADDYVDMAFGSGAVKITPAHDPNDYELAKRHDLPMLNVMNDDGTMNADAGSDYSGMDRYECREKIIADMKELGLIDKIEVHVHQVGFSERGHVPVEPRLSAQWFVRMQPLAEPALQAVVDGRIHFHPDRWTKTYRHWMENIKDWCISRQLWWGHRIPAYYCGGCDHIAVGAAAPAVCPKCGGQAFTQDNDVLDTWFSSWLWPFSTMGWPEETPELQKLYPTQTLVTGPDIIFFWVARMIMAGLKFRGEIPFSDVYFTSIIRDDQGRKLSKSLNNSPDPLDVINLYGADALRFTIIYIAPMGQDIRYSNEKCELGRNFANKIWNACRFRLMQGELSPDWADISDLRPEDLRADDRWILARLDAATREMTEELSTFRYSDLSRTVYEFVWNEFCDWYLESAKAIFYADDATTRRSGLRVFDHVVGAFLRLLHPIMPFITEELYHQMGFIGAGQTIMTAPWPTPFSEEFKAKMGINDRVVAQVNAKFDLIRAIRNVRSQYLIPPSARIDINIVPADAESIAFLQSDLVSLKSLALAASVTVDPNYQSQGPTGAAIAQVGTAYIPLGGLIDVDKELARLQKQADEIQSGIRSIESKLGNASFVARAPAAVVQSERARLAELQEKLNRVHEQSAIFRN